MRQQGETSGRTLCILNSEGFECEVIQYQPTLRVEFTADGDIDADGCPRAYHPLGDPPGLDDLRNAGSHGHWYGIVTDRFGKPFIQTDKDPAPGFYVSPTTYEDPIFPKNDPRRYLDSDAVPFIVVQNYIRRRAQGIVLGCRARVTNKENGKWVDCVVGDIGPLVKLGELSMAAARAIGINPDPQKGGTDDPILKYELWPNKSAIVDRIPYKLIPARAIA